ncbi:MAG TPA: M23 family metallopeptidase [Gaiellaceae bacterium]|nr:M23 family metallopeptidase [Gaiellaceae bacterium]
MHNSAPVLKRAIVAPLAALLLLAAASADAGRQGVQASGSTARAQAVRVVVPNGPGGQTPAVSAPDDHVAFSGGFTYQDPASHTTLVTTGSANASASASTDVEASATASAEVNNLNVFNGEITATSIVAQAHATARIGAAKGDTAGSAVTGLVALGQSVSSGTVALADWGSLTALAGAGNGSAATGYHGSITALEIRLTADHDGLPAGSTILIGYAEVAAQAVAAPPPVQQPKKSKASKSQKTAAPEPGTGLPVRQPPTVTPKLTAGGYVFPVYGPSSFTDTFGGPRSDVSGGWHHGDDIFAPLGAPVLAVATGTVFSVGWNTIGGNRLWVRDGQGNLFYYAHLSAFTPLAVNGSKVNAGDVLGFVGNTGDAQGTPTHLHFEIHPVGLIALGYDGAVDPTTYLLAWKHLQDVSFAGGEAWAPGHSLGNAPKPGAILLTASDISSADGLVPGSLQRAMRPLVIRTGSR